MLLVHRDAAEDLYVSFHLQEHGSDHILGPYVRPVINTGDGILGKRIRLGPGISGEFFIVVQDSPNRQGVVIRETPPNMPVPPGEYRCKVTVFTGAKKLAEGERRLTVVDSDGSPTWLDPHTT